MSPNLESPFNELIVTRPDGQADELIAALSLILPERVQLLHIPLLEISPISAKSEIERLFNAERSKSDLAGLLFVSNNAVKFWWSECLELAIQWTSTPIFAVGEGTATVLQKLTGRKIYYPQQMNAEGLLAMPQLSAVDGQHWVIVKGEGGRPLLANSLRERGADVTEIDVYRRKLPNYDIQQQHYEQQFKQPVWLVTSADAMNNLYRILGLMEKPQHNTQLIVSSDRLATLARQKGFTIIDQSAGASQDQLVQCVASLINH